MGTTITTVGTSLPEKGAFRFLDRDPSGRLWAVHQSGTTAAFWYSDTDGTTWALATGSLTGGTVVGLFVDLDGGLNVAVTGPNYRRGVVTGTTIAWSSPFTLGFAEVEDVIAFRNPSTSGWIAFIVGRPGSGSENYPMAQIVSIVGTTVSQGGIFVLDTTNATAGVGFNGNLDFNHTGDGKTVQGGAPHVYAVYKSGPSALMSRFTWSGTGHSAPSSLVAQLSVTSSQQMVFDGTRVMFTDHDTTADTVSLYERDAGNTATIVRATSPVLTGGLTYRPHLSYDRDGNIWVFAVRESDLDLVRNTWTRASNTWGTWTLVQAATATGLALRKGWAQANFPTIEGLYKDATNLIFQQVAVVNAAPNAPTVLTPIDGSTADVTVTLPVSWTFNDPDQGDTQSAYTVRRRIGTGVHNYWNGTSWVATETATKIISSATTLNLSSGWGADADADHHYSVKTWDSLDQLSPWSAERRVVPSAKDNPTITDPATNGFAITTATYTVVWSVATQTKYRIRVIDDNAGVPNPGIVDYDSGVVNSTSARSHQISLPVNSETRQIELTTWNDEGLLSTVAYRIVSIAYTPPGTPTLTLSTVAVAGAIQVTIDNPVGGVTVGSNDLYRRTVGDTGNGIRVRTNVGYDGVVTDWAVASGIDYSYRAKAIATTGATAFSAWVA